MATLNYSVTDTTITLWVSGLSSTYGYSRKFEFEVGGVTKTTTTSAGVTSSSRVTFTGLLPNTQYMINCSIILHDGNIVYPTGDGSTVRTSNPVTPPSVTVNWDVSVNGLSITASVNSMTNVNISNYYFKFSLYETNTGTMIYDAGSYSKTRTRVFGTVGVKYNTLYTVYLSYSSNGNTADKTLSKQIRTDTQPTTTKWYWSFGTAKGNPFALTATEWLNFCKKVNEVRVAKGLANYGFTTSATYVAKGKNFTATLFKQGASAINDMATINTALLNVSKGDTIYGWYFDELKNKLNGVIDTL